MCVEPGPFRTDFAARSLRQTLSRFDEYESTVNVRLRTLAGRSGRQPGDPVRAAAAIIEARWPRVRRDISSSAPLGLENVRKSLTETLEEIDTWKQTSLGADFPTVSRRRHVSISSWGSRSPRVSRSGAAGILKGAGHGIGTDGEGGHRHRGQ